MAIFKEITEN